MKKITQQSVIKYFLPKRSIERYGHCINQTFIVADELSGRTAWCDFYNSFTWGEYTNAFQEDTAEHMFKHLFSVDQVKLTQEYSLELDPKSIPTSIDMNPTKVILNTKQIICNALQSKLKKTYHYEKNNFLNKGILLIGLCDPLFGGFRANRELQISSLDEIQNEYYTDFLTSSFDKVILLDALGNFHENTENGVYTLFNL